MEKKSLHFTSLHVRKLPGLPDGLKPITDLSKHINIIAGPNASGKTSTANAIQQLLWPPRSGRMNLEGVVKIGNVNWDLRLDYGQYRAQRDGIEGELPGIPAADESKRYVFSLQELVHINDKDLAGKIYQEAMGGYNLGAAATALNYNNDIKKKGIGAYTYYIETERQVAKINGEQQGLKDLENSMSAWKAARDKAVEAGKLKEFYQTVVNYKEARQLKDELEFKLEGFPKQLPNMFGNEYEQITTLEDQIEKLKNGLGTNQETIQRNKKTINELALPETGISSLLLKELEERVEVLLEAEHSISELSIEISGLTATLEALKLQIYPGYQPGDEIKVDLSKIAKLDQFIEGTHRLFSQMRFIQIQIDAFSKKAAPENQNANQIRDGLKTLSSWFSEQNGASGIRIFWLWIIIASAIAVTLAVGIWRWWGMGGLILPIFLAVLAQSKKSERTTEIRRDDFKKTGLKGPIDWELENVRIIFEELNLQLQEAQLYALEKQAANLLIEELKTLQPELQRAENQRDEWIKLLGHAPSLPSDDLKNYSSFFWYISQLSHYARLSAELSGKMGMRQEAVNRHEATLKKVNELLKDLGLEAKDGILAKAAIKHLSEKENNRNNTEKIIQGLIELGKEKEKQLKEADIKLENIYIGLGIETKDKHEVYQLVNQLKEYKTVEAVCQEKKTLFADKERLLQNHEAYLSQEGKLLNLDIAAAYSLRDSFATVATEFEDLNQKIITTNALIQRQRGGQDMEDALAKKEAALDKLQLVYDDNLSALTGSLLISHLEKEGGEHNSSTVLKRGNQLFNRITNGRYELRINDIEQLDFMAYDHTLREGQSLDQLSSGTRIQLLLCIRLAYIESQEKEIQIPIIIDELLANSDDHRAGQIIEALAEIALEGRQVFYFTAQKQEIAKWKFYADAHEGFEVKIHVLESGASVQSDYLRIDSQPFSLNLFEQAPTIAGQTHESYRKLITVPGFQLMVQDPNQIHLWYLVRELQNLASCLEHRILTYGQLISYLKNGGTLQGFDQDNLDEMEKKINLLSDYQKLYQQGRPKVIDLNVLKNSNAVTDRYLQEVYEVLKEVSYNPAELINKLSQNAVSGFRSNSKEKLETYLLNEGYISQEPVFTAEELAQLIQIKVKKLGLNSTEAQRFLEIVNNS